MSFPGVDKHFYPQFAAGNCLGDAGPKAPAANVPARNLSLHKWLPRNRFGGGKFQTATVAICSIALFGMLLSGCRSHSGLPAPSSRDYQQFVSRFYVGLSALQVGND